ncbi:ski family transcriptional corepressor 1 homolog-b-related [Anaeramoeba flamelloides]|uniref:Ski family transcriptional corepressor 1 homolog-b-related n=1 Tax=Anaeramoeba flamelloides TaxID=1746091 RepID=A0ABQ8XW86_9EUKA|nr:ski family transcriptional corepressor 1 homolog-b-related [Anaeramoeba flamelloides]
MDLSLDPPHLDLLLEYCCVLEIDHIINWIKSQQKINIFENSFFSQKTKTVYALFSLSRIESASELKPLYPYLQYTKDIKLQILIQEQIILANSNDFDISAKLFQKIFNEPLNTNLFPRSSENKIKESPNFESSKDLLSAIILLKKKSKESGLCKRNQIILGMITCLFSIENTLLIVKNTALSKLREFKPSTLQKCQEKLKNVTRSDFLEFQSTDKHQDLKENEIKNKKKKKRHQKRVKGNENKRKRESDKKQKQRQKQKKKKKKKNTVQKKDLIESNFKENKKRKIHSKQFKKGGLSNTPNSQIKKTKNSPQFTNSPPHQLISNTKKMDQFEGNQKRKKKYSKNISAIQKNPKDLFQKQKRKKKNMKKDKEKRMKYY